MIPPGAPVASVGDPQTKTVFYFGRTIPSMYLLAGEEDRDWAGGQYHLEDFLSDPQHVAFLEDPRNVAWLFTYGRYVDEVVPAGFQLVHRVQGEQRKKIVFALLRNVGEPPSRPAREGG